MTVPVVLGIDPQKTRLGLALVCFESPHSALWADTLSIDEPDAGWQHEQIRDALANVDGHARLGFYGCEFEITRVGIEQPASIGYERTFEAGGVFHLVLAEAHRRWPWAPQIVRQPSQWKKDALGKGNASKREVRDWAQMWDGSVSPSVYAASQDSADALGVAVSAAKLELVEAA